jgi:hypothetical protein
LTTLRNFPVEAFHWGLGAAVLALLAAAVESRRHPDHALVMGLVTTFAALGAISRTCSGVEVAGVAGDLHVVPVAASRCSWPWPQARG